MNIIQNYVNYMKQNYRDVFSRVLGKELTPKLFSSFYKIYYHVYYEAEVGVKEQDLQNQLYIELIQLAAKEKIKKRTIDNITKLFFFLEGYYSFQTLNLMIDQMVDSPLYHNIDAQKELYQLIEQMKIKALNYVNEFDSHDFSLKTSKLSCHNRKIDHIYIVKLKHDIKMSNLYSDYAIHKALTEGVVGENRLFIEYYMICSQILKDIISHQCKYYILEFKAELLEKNKKSVRLLKVIMHPITINRVSLRITYDEYLKYKDEVEELISQGFQFTILLDSSFPCDLFHLRNLIVFHSILIRDEEPNYQYLKSNVDELTSYLLELRKVV